jgi:RNA polymerase sigma-70 factor, ECF subfamily
VNHPRFYLVAFLGSARAMPTEWGGHRYRRERGMHDPDSGKPYGICGQHATALWRYALRLTGDRALAADVVRETLVRAGQHPKVADAASARAWLFTVARNTIIDKQRGAGFPNEIGAPGSVWPDRAGPDEVNAAVDRVLLGGALAQLPADHRAVVRSAYYEGRTTAQIAAELRIAEGTVKLRLHHALRALWLELREMGLAPR